jgi:uncharacterized membrane protein YfcA
MAVFASPSMPSPAVALALALVAGLAGFVDAIAGGGGLLTLPALLTAGLPAHVALGTNKGCSTWGTAAATFAFARAGKLAFGRAVAGFVVAALGATLGAQLQLVVQPSALRPLVLVLLTGVAIFLAVPRARSVKRAESVAHPERRAIAIALVLGAYDGFFGPGTGTFVIVAHAALLGASLAEATANAKAVNLGSNVASLVVFAWKGTVLWPLALPMAAANVFGGTLGARLAIRRGDGLVRGAVIAVSLALVAKLLADLLRSSG